MGGCRHLGHGETNRWGEELETAVQPSNKCEASRSMYFAERATWAPPATNWWVYRNRLFCAGIQPKHWDDNAVTLDNQILRITHLPWHFGGQRAYFLCDCGRRVGKLYRPPGRQWRCRKCYGLTYATKQSTRRQRLILKAQKVRERLGGKLGVLDVFPEKPKGMHRRRYDQLRHQHDQAVRAACGRANEKALQSRRQTS